jgi:hypothetical protein
MKKILILLTFTLSLSFSQIAQAQYCGTPDNYTPLNKTAKGADNNLYKIDCNYNHSYTTVCINVYFHIVREDDGSGGFNPNNINQIVDNLNAAYNEHGIYIHKLGQGVIDDSDYYNLNTGNTLDDLISLGNGVTNAINFYLVNDGSDRGKAEGTPSKNLYVENAYALSYVSPHEVGHCLGLHHTHKGLGCGDSSGCEELLNGFNCCDCGDEVCDTPADPCVLGKLDINCEYTENDGYDPDTTNFMSAALECSDHFTQGQADRMKFYLENNSSLQDIIGTNCSIPEILGVDTICNNDIKTYTLINDVALSWNISSNLNLVTPSTNTSITVERANSSITGYGYVEAVLQNQAIKKDSIWLGKTPQLTLAKLDDGTYLVHGIPNQVCKNEQITTDISVNGADTVSWTKVSSSHTTTWSQQGINVSFYLWAPNHTATFRLTLTNECGTFIRDYEFKSKICSGGGDPCDLSFSISQNPVDTEIEIINIPAPCDLFKTQGNGRILKDTKATLYDLSGSPIVSQIPSVGSMNVQNLKPGLYILVITHNGGKTNYRIVIK